MTPALLLMAVLAGATEKADKPFAITVVDADTGRGVPLVELRTVHGVRYYTDSNGVVAFREPGLMGRTVFFHVRSHGYEFRKDEYIVIEPEEDPHIASAHATNERAARPELRLIVACTR